MSQYLGDISAYALAVSQGYTGTEEEYAELMASYATVGQTAVAAAQTATTKASEAATSATTATNKASEATTAATTATNKAAEAQADADAAALDASQALSAASTATTKATEATTAAATATSAKTDAVAANTAAQSAKTAAQTAQTGAETAAASVEASAAQIATNASDISQLKSELKHVSSFIDIAKDASANVTNRAILQSGEISVRQKFRMVRVACSPSTTYTMESPKGKYLIVGSSASDSYKQTLVNFVDFGQNPGVVTYTTGTSDVYLFCVFYYQDYTSETDTDCYNALTIGYATAIDKVARDEIDNTNTALSNTETRLDSKIDGLNVAWIKGGKISIIGDSISTYDQSGYKIDGYNMYYPKGDVTSVEDTWWKQIFRYCGGTIEVNASSGESRVTDTNPNVPSLYDRVSLVGNPDTIFIELGTNDSAYAVSLGEYDFESAVADLSESTFRTAYIKGVKTLQASYPTAQIVLIILSMGDTYAESIIHIAQTMSLPYVICRSYGIYQGVHPDKEGMWNIASAITQRNELAQKDADSAVIFTNGIYHKLIFNADGSVTWENPLT